MKRLSPAMFFTIIATLVFIAPQVSGDTSNSAFSHIKSAGTDSRLPTWSAAAYLDLKDIIEGRSCWAIAIDGSTIYAGFSKLLTVLDVSDPANPTKIANLPLQFSFVDILLHGSYAYLLDSEAGKIHILDITDPTSPSIISTNTAGTDGSRLVISDDLLFVAQRWDGLRILDISNPIDPVDVSIYPTTSGAVDVAVEGNYAYIAEYSKGLRIVDVSNPASPTLDTLMIFSGGAKSVDVSDNTVVVTSYTLGGATRVIDISDPEYPFEASTIPGSDHDVVIGGSVAYLVDFEGSFRVLDISDPSNASIVGTETLDEGYRIAVSGALAAVSKSGSGLSVLDVSTPTLPQELSSYPTLGDMEKIALAGDYLAIAHAGGEFWLMNTSNPNERYVSYSYHPYADMVVGLEIQGDYAYVGLNDSWYQLGSGIQIIGLANPNNPIEAGFHLAFNEWVSGIDIDGTRTYYSTHDDLVVVDTSDPAHPNERGRFTPGYTIYEVAAAGSYAYLAQGQQGLAIIDVSNPDSMSLVARKSFAMDVREIVVNSTYAYLAGNAGGAGGLCVIDISNPTNPLEVATFNSGGSATGMVIDGPYLHLTGCTDDRYRILDISDPTNPVEIIYNDADVIRECVAVDPPYVWAISYLHGGLLKFQTNVATDVQVEPLFHFQLKQNYPNPFNPSTTIEFILPITAWVELSVFNVHGERIVTLINERVPLGLNRIGWDGRNRFGEVVSSGVYFYRIRSLGVQETRKMLYLK